MLNQEHLRFLGGGGAHNACVSMRQPVRAGRGAQSPRPCCAARLRLAASLATRLSRVRSSALRIAAPPILRVRLSTGRNRTRCFTLRSRDTNPVFLGKIAQRRAAAFFGRPTHPLTPHGARQWLSSARSSRPRRARWMACFRSSLRIRSGLIACSVNIEHLGEFLGIGGVLQESDVAVGE